MTSSITPEEAAKIAAYLDTHELSKGMGSVCSIAAINLALTGVLTDRIPDCMSPVIGFWIIRIQDDGMNDMRNSLEWKRLLPLVAGTGRALEKQRLAVAMDWMWTVVLPQLQPLADKRGFGTAWRKMTTEKTCAAAASAANAAANACCTPCARAASHAYTAAALATDTVVAFESAATASAASDSYAAAEAEADDAAAARKTFWTNVNPAACLARMIEVTV